MFEKYEKILFSKCMKGESGVLKVNVNRLLNRLTVKIYFRGKKVSKRVVPLKKEASLDLLESMKNSEINFIRETLFSDWVDGFGLCVYCGQFENYSLSEKIRKILAKERLKTI